MADLNVDGMSVFENVQRQILEGSAEAEGRGRLTFDEDKTGTDTLILPA